MVSVTYINVCHPSRHTHSNFNGHFPGKPVATLILVVHWCVYRIPSISVIIHCLTKSASSLHAPVHGNYSLYCMRDKFIFSWVLLMHLCFALSLFLYQFFLYVCTSTNYNAGWQVGLNFTQIHNKCTEKSCSEANSFYYCFRADSESNICVVLFCFSHQ